MTRLYQVVHVRPVETVNEAAVYALLTLEQLRAWAVSKPQRAMLAYAPDQVIESYMNEQLGLSDAIWATEYRGGKSYTVCCHHGGIMMTALPHEVHKLLNVLDNAKECHAAICREDFNNVIDAIVDSRA